MFNFRKINAAQYREPLSKAEENQLLYTSIFMPIVFVALMWLVKIFEVLTGISLASWGVFPLTVKGLRGILFSPLIHGDWNHLISNSVPFIILGFLMLFTYRKVAFKAFVFIYLASGFMLWLTGRPSYHIGASNLVYGFAFFLFFSGVFRKDIQSIALSLFVVFLYGGIVWGLLPLDWHISWEGHLMGGISGAFIAFVYRNVDLPPKIELEDDDDDDDDDFTEQDYLRVVYELKEENRNKENES